VYYSDRLMLLSSDDNTDRIADAEATDDNYDVCLSGRTLYKDGAWNTLCLPFDLTIAGSVLDGDDVDVRTLTSSNLEDGILTLNFTAKEAVTTMEAGKPYIIKWATKESPADNLVNPVFYNVPVENTTDNIGTNVVDFVGTYSPITWETENTSILFLGANNTLYWPKPGKDPVTGDDVYPSIGACRAYFQLHDPQASIRAFHLSFGDGDEAQGISLTSLTPDPSPRGEGSIYTLDGVKLDKMPTRKGVYIMNGRKVVIK